MKYIPLLFSTPMIVPVIDKVKTKTRRTTGLNKINEDPNLWAFRGLGTNPDDENDKRLYAYFQMVPDGTWMYIRCPYGEPGDMLWVREAWNHWPVESQPYIYQATDLRSCGHNWKPSIHMPRKACRLFLENKSVGIERLQDISEIDAVAEGCSLYGPFGEYKGAPHPSGGGTKFRAYQKAKSAFQSVWEHINGEGSWNENPYVWVIGFEKSDADHGTGE